MLASSCGTTYIVNDSEFFKPNQTCKVTCEKTDTTGNTYTITVCYAIESGKCHEPVEDKKPEFIRRGRNIRYVWNEWYQCYVPWEDRRSGKPDYKKYLIQNRYNKKPRQFMNKGRHLNIRLNRGRQ